MTRTGWIGAEAEGPALPVTAMLLSGSRGEQQPGSVLEQSLARAAAAEAREAREAAATAPDPDERASGFVARGYLPGQISQLTMQLSDTVAELEAEEEKMERAARRAERTQRMHARGQIDGFGIVARMGDTDDGDEARAGRLRRRADRLRRQIAEASALMAPQQAREPDGVAEAGRRAHQLYVETTRARLAEAQAGRRREPRPFAGRGGDAVRAEPVTCAACIAIGASETESFQIHHCDADGRPLAAAPEDAELAEYGRQTGQPYRPGSSEAGRYQPVAYR